MEWKPQGVGRVLVGDYRWFEATATCCKINAVPMAAAIPLLLLLLLVLLLPLLLLQASKFAVPNGGHFSFGPLTNWTSYGSMHINKDLSKKRKKKNSL